jgi:hypothetical protein
MGGRFNGCGGVHRPDEARGGDAQQVMEDGVFQLDFSGALPTMQHAHVGADFAHEETFGLKGFHTTESKMTGSVCVAQMDCNFDLALVR